MRFKFTLGILSLLLCWSFAVFPFEVFDEQSHFDSVNFLVEEGRMPTYEKNSDLSIEERSVEYIFGIMTDGSNKYSHNPSYKPEFTESIIGRYESDIKLLNTPVNRSTYTIRQAAIYPPLYYWFASLFYRAVLEFDIIMRLYVTRISSIIFTTAVVVVAYLIGKEIYGRSKIALSLALMTLLYPMTTFIGVGVNSDNLHNLLFGIFTMLCIKLIKSGWEVKRSILIGAVIGLDMITKPQAYIMLPILAAAVLVRWDWSEWRMWFKHAVYIFLPLLFIAGWQEIPKIFGTGIEGYIATRPLYTGVQHFRTYLQGFIYTASHEMIVWYWGVFKWTTVVLPKFWWWIAIRLAILASVGLCLRIIKELIIGKMSWINKVIIFSVLANGIYGGALFWFDWQFYQQQGHSLGMQARYYMPLLVTQMFLLLQGLLALGWNDKVKEWIRKGIVLFFVGLQLTAIYTVASSYYDVSSLQTFIIQASQYKPWFAKGDWWYLWIAGYLVGITYLTWTALTVRDEIEVYEKTTQSLDRRARAPRPARR